MSASRQETLQWFETLTRRFHGEGGVPSTAQAFAHAAHRTRLVAQTRWILLALLGLYGIYAAGIFSFSKFGFFLTQGQLVVLILSVAGVAAYNGLFQFQYARLAHLPLIDHIQIVLDLLFVTILIHYSGGAASWFWPVYLIVTIEAAFLLNRPKDVWMVGTVGGILYGLLLASHYSNALPVPSMPFVATSLHHDPLYFLLMWVWVAILNATVAIITAYLMTVIRKEHQAVRESEERLCNFVETANDLIFCVSEDGRFLYVNPEWQKTLGYSLEDLAELRLQDLIHLENRSRCLLEFRRVLTGDKGSALEGDFIAQNGRRVTVEGNISCNLRPGEETMVWGICRDITQRKAAEEQLYHLAHHDALTGLPNRTLLLDRLAQAKAMANRNGQMVGLLFLDLDRFKLINDTLGHNVGDQLLQAVARRLKACIREVDTLARLGGDEFIIVLVNLQDLLDIKNLASKVLKSLGKPFQIGQHELFVTTSIGISLYPNDGQQVEGLIKKSDIAMYHAKAVGRNNYQFYHPRMDEDAERRLVLANGIRKALEREEFSLHYQPKIDIGTGGVSAMEALVRWVHPELGLLSPGEFIPLAEETGLILPLGEWVLRKACIENAGWRRQGLPPLRVAVNISGYQLQQPNLLDTIQEILREAEMPPESLELEITETVVMQNPDFAVGILNSFRDLGIHISIDDFGTGYSSLAHLKKFSVNTLKIDKSFVRDVEINSADAAIATAIIAMGSSLNLQVIAEGVETEGQYSFLRDKLCHEVQGYLFSKPLPVEEATAFLHQQKDRPAPVPTKRMGIDDETGLSQAASAAQN